MADGYSISHNPDTGQVFARIDGTNQIQEISPKDLAVLQESGPEAFLKSAGVSAGQIATGAGALLGVPGAREKFASQTREQEMRAGGSSWAAPAGAIMPEVAAGIATGGGSVLGSVARTALVEGAIGATRTPDNPFAGAALGAAGGAVGGVAAPVAGAVRRGAVSVPESFVGAANSVIQSNAAKSVVGTMGRMADSVPVVGPLAKDMIGGAADAVQRRGMEGRARRGLSAQATDKARYRGGLMDEEQLADYIGGGFNPERLTSAQRMKLSATDEAAHKEASDILQEQEAFEQGTGGGALTDSVNELQDQKNRIFMREIGADPEVAPDRATLGDNLTRVSGELNKLRGTDPVDVEGLGDMLTKDLVEETVATSEGKAALKQVTDWIDDLTEANGTLTQESAAIIENRLSRNIEAKAKGQSDTEVVDILSTAREALRDRVARTLTPEQQTQDKMLRRQWGLSMAALKRGGALGEEGLNIKSFLNSVGSKSHLAKTGRSKDPLIGALETIQSLTKDKRPDSGTAGRLAAMLR